MLLSSRRAFSSIIARSLPNARGAEALRFGIEAAGMDDAVAIVAARWVHYEVLSAVVWCAEHAAVLVGRASAEKAHLAPPTALSHFIGSFKSAMINY